MNVRINGTLCDVRSVGAFVTIVGKATWLAQRLGALYHDSDKEPTGDAWRLVASAARDIARVAEARAKLADESLTAPAP